MNIIEAVKLCQAGKKVSLEEEELIVDENEIGMVDRPLSVSDILSEKWEELL